MKEFRLGKARTQSTAAGAQQNEASSSSEVPSSASVASTDEASMLETRKRQKEVLKLEYELGKGRRLEWVKAIGPWFTALGIVVTHGLGVSQLHQSQQARDDERFERAVTRLGSLQPTERLTGLTGLEQFLRSSSAERQESCLLFIVNAAVIEKDETVRDALLDALERLRGSSVRNSALSSALASARDRNRALLLRLSEAFSKALPPGQNWPSSPELSEVPIGAPDADGRPALEASARAIAALIRAGAYVDDLSGTYCVRCIFSTKANPANLQKANFDGAFLREAQFESANLVNASFHDADLISTYFNSANLRGANFTADVPATPWQELAAMSNGTTLAIHGADFSCSDLTFADFSGRAVFTILYENPVIGIGGDGFGEANLKSTKLDRIQILLGFPTDLVDSMGGKQKFDFRKLFPIVPGQWSEPDESIPSIKGKSAYYLYTVELGKDFRVDGSFDAKQFWDLILQLRDLNGAQNLDQALLPRGLREFIANNEPLISPSLGKPRC